VRLKGGYAFIRLASQITDQNMRSGNEAEKKGHAHNHCHREHGASLNPRSAKHHADAGHWQSSHCHDAEAEQAYEAILVDQEGDREEGRSGSD
jgi:hypothetical protein